jgi:HK97 family phage major capsid protein
LFGVLPQYAAPGAMIFAHREAIEGVFGRLQQAAGGVTKAETAIGTLPTYNGYPLVTVQTMNVTTSGDWATNDVPILLADLRMASYFGVAREMEFMTSSERYFETNQTGVRGIMFCDINIHDYGSTTAAGSIVGLRSA